MYEAIELEVFIPVFTKVSLYKFPYELYSCTNHQIHFLISVISRDAYTNCGKFDNKTRFYTGNSIYYDTCMGDIFIVYSSSKINRQKYKMNSANITRHKNFSRCKENKQIPYLHVNNSNMDIA
jgi:hypothetical protein